MKKKNQQNKPQQQWQMGPWFMDSCHLRHFLLWQPMNMAPNEGSGYASLWIYFLELLLSSPSAFTLCSCYYPKPYRSGFCLLEWHGLMPLPAPRTALLSLLSQCNISQAVAVRDVTCCHAGLWRELLAPALASGLTPAPRNSDTRCPSRPPLLFVTLYPQSP